MKRCLLIILTLISCTYSHAILIRWDNGGGDGLWSTAANWDGNVVPGPSDDVLLDNSLYNIFIYTVTLPGGNVSVNVRSLTISPTVGNFIEVILPQLNTSPNGFVATATGDAILIDNGGGFLNSSTAAAASNPVSVTAGTVRLNNGGYYIHNTTCQHTNVATNLSSVAGTENGLFVFNVPDALNPYAIQASGITYGSVELASSASGFVLYTATGASPLNINGSLLIRSNAIFRSSMTADIFIRGALLETEPSSLFDLQSGTANNKVRVMGNVDCKGSILATGTGIPDLVLNGTANQDISVTLGGDISGNVILTMDNAAGATLLSPVTLPYRLILTNGKIRTTATNLLTIDYGATCPGGTAASFVEGPMKKIGNENFVFPIGLGTMYAPLGISDAPGGANIDEEFTAEYKRANPQTTYGPAVVTPGLHHVSLVEYWTLEQNPGNLSRNVSLGVHAQSFCWDLSRTYVSRWDGFAWVAQPTIITFTGPLVGVNETGTIKTTNSPSGFLAPLIALTLGTDLTYGANPLPINLIAFDAVKVNSSRSLLNWQLAACCSAEARFEIQRRADNGQFKTIGTVRGSETNTDYTHPDNDLKQGVNYYRLRMIDADGAVTYSRIVAVWNGTGGILLTSLVPTIVKSTASLTLTSSSSQKIEVWVVDMQGRIVMKENRNVSAGNTSIQLTTDRWPAGAYQVFAMSAEGKTNVIRFIKE